MVRRLLAALLAALLLLPLARPDSTSSPPATTAYDELRLGGFPRGLLPTNRCAYTLDASSGDFAVDLRSSCRIMLPMGGYLATFSDRLTGCLDDRRIQASMASALGTSSAGGPSRAPATSFHSVASSSLPASSSTTTSYIRPSNKVTLR